MEQQTGDAEKQPLNNWPDPNKLGWPPNADQDGQYALRIAGATLVRFWSAKYQHYSNVSTDWRKGMSPDDAAVFEYVGRVMSEHEIEGIKQHERTRCATVCENISNHRIFSKASAAIYGIAAEACQKAIRALNGYATHEQNEAYYWMGTVRNDDGIPSARILDLFDGTYAEAVAIAEKIGVEIRYHTEEMPEEMADAGDSLDAGYLRQLDKPSWSLSDGWQLLGAWDNEDGEIVLCYGRKAPESAA